MKSKEDHEPTDPTLDKFGQLKLTVPMTKKIKIYLWKFRGPLSMGHISMRLTDGTYISHWPDRTEKSLKSMLNKPADQMTYDADVILEKRDPDEVLYFPTGYLNEDKIKEWWTTFKNDSTYNLATQNCAHVVSKAIQAGIAPKFSLSNKEINLEKRIFTSPWEIFKKTESLLDKWDTEKILLIVYNLLSTNFFFTSIQVLLTYESFQDIRGIYEEPIEEPGFDMCADLNGIITNLAEDFQTLTQELSAVIKELSKDQKSKPENHFKELNKEIQKTLKDFSERILTAQKMDGKWLYSDKGKSFLDKIEKDFYAFYELINQKFYEINRKISSKRSI